jgi:molybdopterin molybdotransferase
VSETITVEQARELVFSGLKVMPAEDVPILEALGRVLAEDITSDIDVAPFDNSAMDGFAVRAADLDGASVENPVELDVIDHIAAGDAPQMVVGPGQAARIMTGAPMPDGADSVVMVERTRPTSGDGGTGSRVAFELEPRLGEHVRRRGEEVSAGDVVLSEGEVIGPAAIGLLASTGHATVPVHARPRVAIISTGSELVEVAEKPGPGKIRNSNSYSIAAQVLATGAIPVRFPIVPDDVDSTRQAFERAADECDYIITSGGVSVGDFDYVKPVLEQLGELTFCKVAMRPGNPQTLGSIKGVPFFGLPGNPTSTYVGFEIFVRPSLRKMMGFSAVDRPVTRARLSHDVKKKQDRRYYLRGRVERDESAEHGGESCGYVASLSGSQSSALLTAAHRGNCFVVLRQGEGFFEAGTIVDCIRLDMEEGTP